MFLKDKKTFTRSNTQDDIMIYGFTYVASSIVDKVNPWKRFSQLFSIILANFFPSGFFVAWYALDFGDAWLTRTCSPWFLGSYSSFLWHVSNSRCILVDLFYVMQLFYALFRMYRFPFVVCACDTYLWCLSSRWSSSLWLCISLPGTFVFARASFIQ